jgi:hypothetical protein
MTYPDFIACVRALRAKNNVSEDQAPDERAWFEAVLQNESH